MRYLYLIIFIFAGVIGYSQQADSIHNAFPGNMEGEKDKKRFYVSEITLKGNKITKDRIIYRELLFAVGDTLLETELSGILEKSRENLLNTSLFNFVTIDTLREKGRPIDLNIQISMLERWYIWPFPIFELSDRNFNSWLASGDISRVSYGAFITWDNFRGRKETLKLRLRFGYNELYDFFYQIPYINRRETLGIGFGAGIAGNHEAPYETKENNLEYYKNTDKYVKKEGFAFVQLLHRKDIYNSHKLEIAYNNYHFDDSLISLNPAYSFKQRSDLEFFSVFYEYRSDHRDFKAYPLTGYYFDAGFEKIGLGILDNGGLDLLEIKSTFRKYWKLNNRFYFAWGLNAKFSNDKVQPYFLLKGLGYGRDFVRSYEYYVIDGRNFGLMKSNLKFALLPPRVFNLGFIPTEKFSKVHFAIYTNLFVDLGFADNPQSVPSLNNDLENSLLLGYGIGLDFVTYYDIVFRTEFSVNRMGEYGFFLHFMAPI